MKTELLSLTKGISVLIADTIKIMAPEAKGKHAYCPLFKIWVS